ncbi:hypothetical protein NUW58_g7923 [Xylaria curta]|uniref:Uncharacterized protein n=1 Tax=Xylaria curta TaxID=42375 RepID=A0ACC1NCM4_9PEZI|nr:hypothetical protein NUW58_g7923 [Xylaria curta]
MNGQHMVGLQASQHAPQLGGQQSQQQQRKTLFTPYLPQATLPALLGDGQLVSGILRVNKKNRSDAYVATSDGLLDADIFICGSKDRNRALEGDLVAVELLDVDEVWGQKREKEEKKKRKDITDTRTGSTNGNGTTNATNGDDSTTGDGGIRRKGSLRQRPTQKKNDDVEVEGQSLLLVEEEEINDESKPLYAGHIVAVIERVAGQMFSGTLGLLRPSSQATKEKQEAERAARDGGRPHDHRQQDKPKIVWFKPTDKRVPLIAIPTEQAPRDFVEKHQDYADRIFVACIKRWPITSLHPFGTLVEQLGKMGDLKVETDALLRDNNFSSDEFSEAVLRSVGLQDWSIAKEDEAAISARRDFRGDKVFTFDLAGTGELGDAVHVKTQSDGKIEIGIHVPDVTHFVKPNSLVDREAKKRGTAVHLVNRTCALLPPKIASELCTLTPGQDRLTVSVVFKVNPHTGAVAEGDAWIGKSIVKSSAKLSLKDIDEALAGGANFQHESAEIKDIQILNVIAQKFQEARLGSDGEVIAPLHKAASKNESTTIMSQQASAASNSPGAYGLSSLDSSTREAQLEKENAILESYQAGRPLYLLDDMFNMQNFVSNKALRRNYSTHFYDFFGDTITMDVPNNDSLWFVALYNLQNSIIAIRTDDIDPPFFYCPREYWWNPAKANTNPCLWNSGLPREDWPEMMNVQRVRGILDEAARNMRGSTFQARIMETLSNVYQDIDSIVCFELGTIEADVCRHYIGHDVSRPCATQHLLAISIKDHIRSINGWAPKLVFQDLEYTDDTADILEGQGAIVLRDRVSAFSHVTANTLVLWTRQGANFPTPVNQVIADFPFQPSPRPVPRAMIWPREKNDTASIGVILGSIQRDINQNYLDNRPADGSPRTHKLLGGYDEHLLPRQHVNTPFYIAEDQQLVVYVRK